MWQNPQRVYRDPETLGNRQARQVPCRSFSTTAPRNSGGKQVLVKTIAYYKDEAVQLDYLLEKRGGTWRIVNYLVDGVDTIRNYQRQFKRILEKDSLAGLLSRLQKKKRAVPAGTATVRLSAVSHACRCPRGGIRRRSASSAWWSISTVSTSCQKPSPISMAAMVRCRQSRKDAVGEGGVTPFPEHVCQGGKKGPGLRQKSPVSIQLNSCSCLPMARILPSAARILVASSMSNIVASL